MSIIAENTRRIIQERGLKQCAVAQRAGYKVKTFNNLLTGRKIITDRDIEAIAKTLGVSPNVLLGYEDFNGDTSVAQKIGNHLMSQKGA